MLTISASPIEQMALAKLAHEGVSMTDVVRPVATWRKVLGAILDFLTVFFVGGYAIGYLTGNVTAEGFNLQGTPALILLAVIIFTS
jgi:hypothetical protein